MQSYEWNDIACFLALARHGSMTAAARAVGVHGTTLGRQLARLEEALGASLFERTPRGLRLTDTGERILPLAQEVESTLQRLHSTALARDRTVHGEVVLATSSMLARYLVVPTLPALAERWPDLSLRVVSQTEHRSLAQGELSLAFRLVPEGRDVSTPGMIARRVGSAPFQLFGHRDTVQALDLVPPLDDLLGLPMIRYGSGRWEPGGEWLESLDSPGTVVATANEMPVVLGMVQHGVGLAVLPRFVARHHPELQHLTDTVTSASLWLVYPPQHRHVARIKAVADWIVEQVEG